VSYASIMVYVEIEGIPEQRVRIASELAEKFDAALIGFSARAVPPPFVAEGVIIEEATELDIKQMQAALTKRGDWFRGVAGADPRNIEWRTALDFPTPAISNTFPTKPRSSVVDTGSVSGFLPSPCIYFRV
jgi:hypothetical protein